MKLEKAEKRDRKQYKRTKGMRVTGKSIFTIVAVQVKKSQEAKDAKKS